jgi:hypothetical protein
MRAGALGRGGIEGLERAEAEAERVEKTNHKRRQHRSADARMNEAREDAIELAKTLRECVAAFKAIRDAATIPGVGLPRANVAFKRRSGCLDTLLGSGAQGPRGGGQEQRVGFFDVA